MAVTGPDFISLQVRDLERSAAFYEQYLGLKRSDAGPPHAGVFDTKAIAFAVSAASRALGLDAIAQPGRGMALWLHAPDAQDIHDALAAAGTTIVSAPVDGPCGCTFTFADPDGYQVTLHDRGCSVLACATRSRRTRYSTSPQVRRTSARTRVGPQTPPPGSRVAIARGHCGQPERGQVRAPREKPAGLPPPDHRGHADV